MYIDTEGSFFAERAAEMADALSIHILKIAINSIPYLRRNNIIDQFNNNDDGDCFNKMKLAVEELLSRSEGDYTIITEKNRHCLLSAISIDKDALLKVLGYVSIYLSILLVECNY